MTAPTPAAVAKECAEAVCAAFDVMPHSSDSGIALVMPMDVATVLAPILARHLARAEQAVALLREVDAMLADEMDWCPICDCHQSHGHAPDCRLAALLACRKGAS